MEFHLAAKLGMTRRRLRLEMPTSEWTGWVAYLEDEVEAQKKAAAKKK